MVLTVGHAKHNTGLALLLDVEAGAKSFCACGEFTDGDCPKQTRVGGVTATPFTGLVPVDYEPHGGVGGECRLVESIRVSGRYRCAYCRDVHSLCLFVDEP